MTNILFCLCDRVDRAVKYTPSHDNFSPDLLETN